MPCSRVLCLALISRRGDLSNVTKLDKKARPPFFQSLRRCSQFSILQFPSLPKSRGTFQKFDGSSHRVEIRNVYCRIQKKNPTPDYSGQQKKKLTIPMKIIEIEKNFKKNILTKDHTEKNRRNWQAGRVEGMREKSLNIRRLL